MSARPEADIQARQLPGWADTALMTSAVVLIALLAAATAAALIALADARPDLADQLDDHIAHLVDLTGGRTPQQIAQLPQCQE